MVAVDADHVVPVDEPGGLGIRLGESGDGPAHEPTHHDHLVAQLLRRELDLLDGLFGRVHGDDGGGNDAILETAELVSGEHVVGAANRAAKPGVLHAVITQPRRRVHDAEINAEVVQALVHQARKHGRRPVEHVLARGAPEGLLAHPAPAALSQRHLERIGDALAGEVIGFRRRLAPDAPELLAHDRAILDPVPVGVDDGVAQASVELPGFRLTVGLHGRASQNSGLDEYDEGIVNDSRGMRHVCAARCQTRRTV